MDVFFVEAQPFFLLAMAVSVLGFYRLVYFVSLGYAFSIAGIAGLSLWRFSDSVNVPIALQCTALAAYGLRLGAFLVRREREPSYRKELAEIAQRGAGITRPVQVAIWIGVSLLYVLMFSPALFNLVMHRGGAPSSSVLWLGLGLMVFGFGLESVADLQKSAFKREHPDRFCDVKLYRVVRCPNYLGEVFFWVGNFVAGIGAYGHWGTWVSAATGLVCIVLIMMGSTKRLEHKQDERYGTRPEYQAYVRSVPVLFPFVPVYSLKNIRVYLE